MLKVVAAMLALAQNGPRADPGPGQPTDLHARPSLIAESRTAAAGETLWLALDFEIDPGWHTYWPGQNDSGFALEAKFDTSPNATVGELVWPAPHRYFPTDGILDHVFEERMTVLVPVAVSPDARPGDVVRVRADLAWLTCAEVCLAESGSVALETRVSADAPEPNAEAAQAFREARDRLPRPHKPDDGVQIDVSDASLRITVRGASRLAFYPLAGARRPRNLIRDGEREGDRLEIELREGEEPIAGVLEVWRAGDATSRLFELSWPAARGAEAPARAGS